MLHSSQLGFKQQMGGELSPVDFQLRMCRPVHAFANRTSEEAPSDVFSEEQQRVNAILRGSRSRTVRFDTATLNGAIELLHFKLGADNSGHTKSPAFYSEKIKDETVHELVMPWESVSAYTILKRGREKLLADSDMYTKCRDDERVRRISAFMLMQDGLGHVEKFPTGSRHEYDARVANLRATGTEYVKFSDGFHPCIMTGITQSSDSEKPEDMSTSTILRLMAEPFDETISENVA